MLKEVLNRVRKNHALEHGTVTLLLEHGVKPPMGGYSTSGGFFIFGRVPKDLLNGAVYEAYTRMSDGENELAISPYCGTNLATSFAISSVASKLFMRLTGNRVARIPVLVLTFVCAMAMSRPLGNALQRRFTTLADMGGYQVRGIRSFALGSFAIHRVSTTS